LRANTRRFDFENGIYNFSAMYFSSLTVSAANTRMPSRSSPWPSLVVQQVAEFLFVKLEPGDVAFPGQAGLSLRSTGAVLFFNSASSDGLMVSQVTHPASSRISPHSGSSRPSPPRMANFL